MEMEMEIIALVTLAIALLQWARSLIRDNANDQSQAMSTELALRKRILILEDRVDDQKTLIKRVFKQNRRMKKFILDTQKKT